MLREQLLMLDGTSMSMIIVPSLEYYLGLNE